MRITKLEASGSRILGELRLGLRLEDGREREERHRAEWPSLWAAIDDFLELIHESDPTSQAMRGEWSPKGITGGEHDIG